MKQSGREPSGGRRPLAALASKLMPELRERVTYDAVDLKLLELLGDEARESRRSLAKSVGMSAPAVGERIARLERLGVIRRYGLDIDWELLGVRVVAFLGVKLVATAEFATVMQALEGMAEVVDLHVVSGSSDFLLKVRVTDHDHLRRLLFQVWDVDGVERTDTTLSIVDGQRSEMSSGLLGLLED